MAKAHDPSEYRMYTGPAELHKAVNTLRGIVAGISCSSGVSQTEMDSLVQWCSGCDAVRDRHPFSELMPVIERSMEDGSIDEEEKEDILWLCSTILNTDKYYDLHTSSVQFLTGLVQGIMADGTVDNREIASLQLWMSTNDYLMGTYPFDDLHCILQAILEDQVITEQERAALSLFASSLIEPDTAETATPEEYEAMREKYTIASVYAKDPEIIFNDHTFCFTGESRTTKRSAFQTMVEQRGGIFSGSFNKKVDYLIVGNKGSDCWAFSRYGRKVESAINLQKSGGHVLIIREADFWEAYRAEQDSTAPTLRLVQTSHNTYQCVRE